MLFFLCVGTRSVLYRLENFSQKIFITWFCDVKAHLSAGSSDCDDSLRQGRAMMRSETFLSLEINRFGWIRSAECEKNETQSLIRWSQKISRSCVSSVPPIKSRTHETLSTHFKINGSVRNDIEWEVGIAEKNTTTLFGTCGHPACWNIYSVAW